MSVATPIRWIRYLRLDDCLCMECFEKGYLTINDTEGLDLRFGNAEAMLKAIDLIAERKGFGNVLAEGSARLAHKIGQDSINFAIQVRVWKVRCMTPE